MILLDIATWAFVGLVLAIVYILARKAQRPLDVLTAGALSGLIGGALGHRLSDPHNTTGFDLVALVAAAIIALGGLALFDYLRAQKKLSH